MSSLTACFATSSIRSLYSEAFPKEERYPFFLLRLLSMRRGVQFLEYRNEKAIALSYTVEGEQMVFILYLAVAEDCRSRGYGSEVLAILKERYPGKALTLNIEPLDEGAENFLERKRRFAFYQRNGFYDTGCTLTDETMTYMVLSTAESFDPDEYRETLKRLHPFGIGMPEIEER